MKVPLLNLLGNLPKKKNTSPIKEDMQLTGEGVPNLTSRLPIRDALDSQRMPYMNSSRMIQQSLLTERRSSKNSRLDLMGGNNKVANEIDAMIDKANK